LLIFLAIFLSRVLHSARWSKGQKTTDQSQSVRLNKRSVRCVRKLLDRPCIMAQFDGNNK